MRDYSSVFNDMRAFTDARKDLNLPSEKSKQHPLNDKQTNDELWVVEHPAVYTLGQSGKREHILNSANIPVVESDRGGQVTYHGPGQVVIYTLFNLRKAGFGIRELVIRLENSVIDTLKSVGVDSKGRRDAPGVYVQDAKIAALGLRVRKGCAYHGLSLNIEPDLAPFLGINPCGYEGLEVTSLKKLGVEYNKSTVIDTLLDSLIYQLGQPVRSSTANG